MILTISSPPCPPPPPLKFLPLPLPCRTLITDPLLYDAGMKGEDCIPFHISSFTGPLPRKRILYLADIVSPTSPPLFPLMNPGEFPQLEYYLRTLIFDWPFSERSHPISPVQHYLDFLPSLQGILIKLPTPPFKRMLRNSLSGPLLLLSFFLSLEMTIFLN